MKDIVLDNKEKRNTMVQWLTSKIWAVRRSILSEIAPEYLSKKLYRHTFHRELNLDNPVYFNEKLMWLKLKRYANDPLVIKCTDKYAVREYVEQCGLGHILNDLLGVWENANQIEWDKLPNRFVLKCNNGCGTNIICQNKNSLDRKEAVKKLNRWLRTGTWREYAELHYKKIHPRIICEKYLEGINGMLPSDYKVYCFHGQPVYIGCFLERDMVDGAKYKGFFDLNWQPSEFIRYEFETDMFPRPTCLNQMIEYSRILSQPFPMVRVDFYEIKGKLYFGELTFTPRGCLADYHTDEAYLILGNLIPLE